MDIDSKALLKLSSALTVLAIILVMVFQTAASAWPFQIAYDGYHRAYQHLTWHYGSNLNSAWQANTDRAINTLSGNDGTPFHTHYDTSAPNHVYLTGTDAVISDCWVIGRATYDATNANARHIDVGNVYVNARSACGFSWYSGTGSPGSTQLDAWSNIAHELGHTLPLGHGGNVMSDALSFGETTRVLGTHDKWALNELFSCHPVPLTGC